MIERNSMADVQHSHRRILRSSSILGGASAINVALSIVRMKCAAVTIGLVGVGAVGLFQNFVMVASAIGSAGIGNAAPRQIAAEIESDREAEHAATRRALVWCAAVFAVLAAALIWSFSNPLARYVLGDPSFSGQVRWLGLAVALTIASGAQLGLLIGYGRFADTARITLIGGILTTIVFLPLLYLEPRSAVMALIVATPGASFIAGIWYVSRLPRQAPARARFADVARKARDLLALGAMMTLAGLVTLSALMIVRRIVLAEFQLASLGEFQAAWAIGATYLMLVLQAMSTDFFPRLTSARHNSLKFNQLIVEQTETALLIGGPMILITIGAAPLILRILYGEAFIGGAEMLRWQLFGDILKIMSWPLGFALLAHSRGIAFVLCELAGNIVFVAVSWVLVGRIGLGGVGIAYLSMYMVYLPITYFLVRERSRFVWSKSAIFDIALLLCLAGIVLAVVPADPIQSSLIGAVAAAGFALRSVHRIKKFLRVPVNEPQ
jgi:PST family polysaccharide transporter